MTLFSTKIKVQQAIQHAMVAFNCTEFEACTLIFEIVHERANCCKLQQNAKVLHNATATGKPV